MLRIETSSMLRIETSSMLRIETSLSGVGVAARFLTFCKQNVRDRFLTFCKQNVRHRFRGTRESGKMLCKNAFLQGNEEKQKQEKAKIVKRWTSNFKINQSNTLQSQLPELHNKTIGFFRETYQFKNRFLGYTKCVPSFIFNF
ncbi:MAG: hypothetical protein EOO35_00835, partial [Cyanobacteriota bacterium]